MEIVGQHFRPEFINRVDEVVVFHPLGTRAHPLDRRHPGRVPAPAAGGSRHRTRARRRGARPAGRGGLRSGVRRAAAEARDPAPAREPAGAGASCAATSGRATRVLVTASDGKLAFDAARRGRNGAGSEAQEGLHSRAIPYNRPLASRHADPTMPIYEYQCAKCGHHLEALQKISDKPLRECPECGKHTLKRLMSAPMFRLAGSGWYETDFKSDKEQKRNLVGERRRRAGRSRVEGRGQGRGQAGRGKPRPSRSRRPRRSPRPTRAASGRRSTAAEARCEGRRAKAPSRKKVPVRARKR